MSKNQSESKPTNVELLCAGMLVCLPRPKPDDEDFLESTQAFAAAVSHFLMCDGPERMEPRMAAIAEANKKTDNPINIEAFQLPQPMMSEFITKLETMAKNEKGIRLNKYRKSGLK